MEIKVNGVSFSYGRKRVLRAVEWRVRPGVTGLLGPNGSGKTTLLRVLIGLLRPSEGSVVVRQGDTAGDESWVRVGGRGGRHAVGDGGARFGFVPQRFSMDEGMRVADAVAYTAWTSGLARAECEAAASRALEVVDLAGQARAKVKTLSGGQRQRVGIAAGIAHDPDVLVLDEPTVGLDAGQRQRAQDMIAEIGRTRTVVVSTHLLDEVSYMCDRIGVLASGALVLDGTVAELEALSDSDSDLGRDVDDDVESGARADARQRSRIERGYERLLDTVGGQE